MAIIDQPFYVDEIGLHLLSIDGNNLTEEMEDWISRKSNVKKATRCIYSKNIEPIMEFYMRFS